MKKNILFFAVLSILIGCKSSDNNKKDTISASDISSSAYNGYGGTINSDEILSQEAISDTYNSIKAGDTLNIAFTSTVNSVCKAKGCWMRLALADDKETMVKFKDYGFFVPTDLDKNEVIVQGKAYVTEMSVDEQRHFASDAGKSEEEIAAITEPKRTLSFLADGVLVKK